MTDPDTGPPPAGAARTHVVRRTRRPELLVATVLLLGVLLGFSGIVSNGFVSYDDDAYVAQNIMVSQGVTAAGVRWAFTTFHAANWHPLTWLSHMLDVQLFGLDPAAHPRQVLHLLRVGLDQVAQIQNQQTLLFDPRHDLGEQIPLQHRALPFGSQVARADSLS
jgi:hypothetical protein